MKKYHSSTGSAMYSNAVSIDNKHCFAKMNNDEDNKDDFSQFRLPTSISEVTFNEFDHYIELPSLGQKIQALNY